MSDLTGRPFVRVSLFDVQRDNELMWDCTWTNMVWHPAGFHQEAASITTVTANTEGVLELLQEQMEQHKPFSSISVVLNGVEVIDPNTLLQQARAIMRMDEGEK